MTNAFISDLTATVNEFVAERDWQQFHSPKNLAMALIVEAAELVEHFQWLTANESASLDDVKKSAVAEELADVLVYLVCIADRLEIDLEAAAFSKIGKNREKYPVERARGHARKPSES
ncbi:MAG: nucleotide pyrophosphohydrolase [Pseudomonadota bacterium]|jgi:NTP pyrophosphatase (non-canonical NTP hydrolase)|nr:nucleotide pyrophosphohydrolase [Pseudomonadota bacterium]